MRAYVCLCVRVFVCTRVCARVCMRAGVLAWLNLHPHATVRACKLIMIADKNVSTITLGCEVRS